LHVPSLPHAPLGVQRASACPVKIGAHVPLACPVLALLHAMHVPHAPAQHTPSVHMPDAHWLAVAGVQVWPFALRHAWFWHTLPVPQVTPHAPQFGLAPRETQAPPHTACPA